MSAAVALAKDVVALFGGLCLLVNVLLPVATLTLQLAVFDAPELLGRWRASRAQQQELNQLIERLERLKRRRRRRKKKQVQHDDLEREDAKQCVRRRRRRRQKSADDADEVDAKSALLSRAEIAASTETEARQQQQQRHRLSIYSTVKKAPRPQVAHETESDR